tara:strand:- start:484 stop:858 length:375 start_codon:yes stop_codon:yes gene_type:complete
MVKGLINRNLIWLILSFSISFLFSIPESNYREDFLAEDICKKLPYEVSYNRRKISMKDFLNNKVDLSKINIPDLTSEEISIEDYCLDVLDRVKRQRDIRDDAFNVLQLWAIIFVSAYVLKYKTK